MSNIAIITGASSGIGKEFLLTMPKDKVYDEIWVMARNRQALLDLSNLTDKNLVVVDGDLTDNRVIDRLIAKLEEEKPVVKLLINCSGFGKFGKTGDVNMDESLNMIDLNCRALTAVTLACLPYMERGSEIMQVASIAGFAPIPYLNVYAASKAYVLSFAHTLKSEYKKQGIKVLAVCPFWTKTQFFDRAKNSDEQIIKKYFVMYDPKKVAIRAWKDLKHNRYPSSYGAFNKFLVFLMKLTPVRLKHFVWKKVQKLD